MTDTQRLAVAPCVHPRCRDQGGNPRLTTQVLCDACRHHLERQLAWLAEDYRYLKSVMPKPPGERIRGSNGEPGHPAQWASDMCKAIASNLSRIEDDARDALHEPPSFNLATARESTVVTSAIRYLDTRIDRIVAADRDIATDMAETVHELHRTVRNTLGYNKPIERLPGAHCPSCDVAALVKTTGQVTCDHCGRAFPEEDYERLAAIIAYDSIDRLITAYETRETTAT